MAPAAARATIADKLLPFLTGVTVGVLATLATFSGRVASLETRAGIQETAITKLQTEFEKLNDNIIAYLRR